MRIRSENWSGSNRLLVCPLGTHNCILNVMGCHTGFNLIAHIMKTAVLYSALFVFSLMISIPRPALAADLTYNTDTTITVGSEPFTISAGSEATSLALGLTNLIVTVPTGSTFTLVSPNRRPLDNTASIAESCTASENELAVTGAVTVTITPDTDGICTTATSLSIRLARIFGTQQNNMEGSSGGTSSAPPPAPAPSPPAPPPAETPAAQPSPVVLPNEPAPSTLPSDPVVNFPGIPRIISDSVLGRATPSAATEQLRVGTFSYGAARVSSLKSESINAGVLSDHLHEQFSPFLYRS